MLKLPATTKYPTSRIKLRRATRKGLTRAIEPATTAVIKQAAPINSPTARLPLFEFIAANVEKTSGLPFPKARNVTPVKLSLIPRMLARVLKLMQRKSLAAIPIVLKSTASHRIRRNSAKGWAWARLQ
jgi:hypothetical protein